MYIRGQTAKCHNSFVFRLVHNRTEFKTVTILSGIVWFSVFFKSEYIFEIKFFYTLIHAFILFLINIKRFMSELLRSKIIFS